MEILEAYDLTGSLRDAAELAGCSHHTVADYVAARERGELTPGRAQRREMLVDPYLPKLEEWVEHSRGKVRADVAHDKLVALGYVGSERTTRRAVAEVKAAYRAGRRRVHRPWVPEPGMWFQYDFGDGPRVRGVATQLFCAWLAWCRFRVVLALLDKTLPSVMAAIDTTLRTFGGVPTYGLCDYVARHIIAHQWARDTAGLAPATLDGLTKPIIEICRHYGVVPWRLTPRQVDGYFAGVGKRARSTVRRKMTLIDHYFAFLEQRYAGEIARRYGAAVESPIDPFNRPKHRGDYGLRIPPSHRAMREFFGRWRESLPEARKPVIARRDYVMGKLTYISGVRAAELCGVRIGDVHWESGQWGRFLVHGKGARGSGPRQREAYLFEEGRALLWWYMEEVRAEFCDSPDNAEAPLFPSERIPQAVSALNVATPGIAVTPSTFRRTLKFAGHRFLTGPVTELHPHLLRHACATHNYERGMSLWEVRKLLGHDRPTTTVSYLATAHADPETASLAAAGRAVQRLVMDKGSLR